MDRLDELIVFTAILDAGSLAGAARRLRRSPPAVTRSLATLEDRVGARLVQRTTRQFTPTPSGRRLALHAKQVLADYEQAVGSVKEKREAPLHGLLRITAPSLFGRLHIAPLVFSFLDTHPGIRIDLMLTNRDLDLIEEGLDIAVRIGPLARAGLIARRVGHVRRVLSASPEYVARRGRPRTPRDLVKHDIVHNWTKPSPVEWRFRFSGRDLVVRPTPRLMDHRGRRSAGCSASRTRDRPDALISGGGRLCFGRLGASPARVRISANAGSSRGSERPTHAAKRACLSRSRCAGSRWPSRNQ